ncbi:hypothetical protein ACLB2K_019025 [Fragaria x ananassa]
MESDEAMRKALDNVMSEARQRLCAWHVGKNVVSHLRDPCTLADFFHHIFAGMSIEEWEVSWKYFVSMNKLQGNPWICGMYKKSQRWAEAFFRDEFYAGISSTQRCKGMHRILKVGIGSWMTMSEMMPRLEKSAARLRNRDTDGMGLRSSDMEGDLSTDESSDKSGSSDVDVGDEESLKTCEGKLYHHLEEARTFEFISGEVKQRRIFQI